MTATQAGSSRQRICLPRPASALLATALATLVVSCNDRSPTKPAAPSVQAAAPSFARSLSTSGSGELVSDARGRLSASIADMKSRVALQHSLDALSAALEAGDTATAKREIETARKLIAAGLSSQDGADLSAISLALDQIETQLSDANAPAQP